MRRLLRRKYTMYSNLARSFWRCCPNVLAIERLSFRKILVALSVLNPPLGALKLEHGLSGSTSQLLHRAKSYVRVHDIFFWKTLAPPRPTTRSNCFTRATQHQPTSLLVSIAPACQTAAPLQKRRLLVNRASAPNGVDHQ